MAAVIRLVLVALTAGGLTGAAAPADRRDPLAGRVAGQPVDCVDNARLTGPEIVDDRTILYRQNGARTWRNDLPERCPALSQQATLVVEVYGSQLCRDDHFRVVAPGSVIASGYCRLGAFTPFDKP